MSSGGQIALRITAEEAQALAALGRLVQAQDSATAATKRYSEANRQAAAEARAMDRDAGKIREAYATPVEQFQQRLARLKQLREADKINEQQYARAKEDASRTYVAAVQKEFEASEQGQALAAARAKQLDEEAASARTAAREEEALAKAAERVKAAYESPIEKYNAKRAELNTLLKQNRISQEEYNRAVQDAKDKYENATRLEAYNAKLSELRNRLRDGKMTQDEYNRSVAQAKREYDGAAASGDQAFGGPMAAKVKELAVGFGMAFSAVELGRGALRLVRDELDAIFERHERARQTSMTEAEAQRDFLVNLGAMSAEERDQAIAEVEKISSETGVSKRDIYMRAGTAVSAKGQLSVQEALEAVRVSAQLLPGSPEAGRSLAGSAMDLDTILKGRGREVSAEQTIGFIQSIGETARVVDPEKLARNVMPAVSSAMATGATEQEAGALWSAFTKGMKDVTGEQSKTASIKFAQQLDEFFTAALSETATPEEIALQKQRQGVTGFGARLSLLQQDEEQRKAFLGDFSTEAAAMQPSRELVTGQGEMAQAYSQYVKQLPSVEQSAEAFRKRLAIINQTDLQVTGDVGRATTTSAETMETTDPEAARIGAIRKEYTRILGNLGQSRISTTLNRMLTEAESLSGGGVEPFIENLKSARDASLYGPAGAETGGYGPSYGVPMMAPSQQDRKNAEILTQLITKLEEANGLAREQIKETRETKENTKRLVENNRGRLGNPDRDK